MTMRPQPYAHLDREETWRGLDELRHRAEGRGADMPTLALAWLLSDPRITAVVVGPRRPEHLEPADVLVDQMRGRSSAWYRIRLNLQHVPEKLRPRPRTPSPARKPE